MRVPLVSMGGCFTPLLSSVANFLSPESMVMNGGESDEEKEEEEVVDERDDGRELEGGMMSGPSRDSPGSDGRKSSSDKMERAGVSNALSSSSSCTVTSSNGDRGISASRERARVIARLCN